MELRLALDGRLAEAMAAQEAAIAQALTLAAEIAAENVKNRVRRDVVAAGLGRRLANTIRHGVYPRRGASLSPAGVVTFKAQDIWRGLTEAITIRGTGGNWLAIPTEHAPAKLYGKRVTPELYERRYGAGRLGYVELRPGRSGMLVDSDLRRRRGARGGFAPRSARSRDPAETVPMFWLVREVRTRPRLSLPDYEAAGARLFEELAVAQVARVLADDGSAERVEGFVAGSRAASRALRSSRRRR